jgi:hypothetical protein
MKNVLIFIIGLLVGIGVHWYVTQPTRQPPAVSALEPPGDRAPRVDDRLTSERIKEDLERTGKVIREKAREAGDVIADATANARTTAAIKSKLVGDSGLAAFKIDVDSNNGVVTLSGTVSSYEDIEKAINIASETKGVHKVVSTLQPEVSQPEVVQPEVE